ncbi:hypothetical protein JKF63_00368 [Porcisia hertigi]|uniref:Uncharacterized protein n=1 Tax=Porcisia hertigi TaxID=2761500 RepID=A0A836KX31_9TRYP|nr:hypothetical protein JKF63_00368 [Porcisia hertigi]
MSVDNTFEAFCTRSALQQRRDGLLVPSESSHSFSYYQWLEVAKEKYANCHPPASSSGQQQLPAKREKKEVIFSDPGSGLANGLAQQLRASLERQTTPNNMPTVLGRASQDSFPMPQASAEMPVFLALAEAAIRLTLWIPEDMQLAQLAARLRPNLRTLEERGVIRLYHGCFPSLQVLMDLLSWRIIAHRWDCLTPEKRQVALDGVLGLCSALGSVSTEALRAAVHELFLPAASSPSLDSAALSRLDTLVGHVSSAVPFQFPICHGLVPLYPEPVGQLHVPGEPLVSAHSMLKDEKLSRPVEVERIVEDAEMRIGELLNVTSSPTPTPALHAPSAGESPSRRVPAVTPARPPSDPFDNIAPCITKGKRPRTSVAQTRHQNPTRTASGHIPCMSQYHARYAEPAKHASSECPYCATCHLMEIIFRDNRQNCTWGHWPTPRKIHFHLKRFPQVMKLAQERAAAMQRGVQLAATDKVPL